MKNKIWTVARFPDGSWSYGGKPTDPEYAGCEVFRISAVDGMAAKKKAQAKRSREHRLPVGHLYVEGKVAP